MSSGTPLNSARRTQSFLAAELHDTAAVKTSAATTTSIVTVLPAAMNGAGMLDAVGRFYLPRAVLITMSASSGSYSTNPIVITGKRGPNTITESLTPANANGGATLTTYAIFDQLISVVFPAQVNGSGAFTIGLGDIGAPFGSTFTAVKLHADGDLVVSYGENYLDNAPTDLIPCLAQNREPIAPNRILTDPGSTAVGLTLYLP